MVKIMEINRTTNLSTIYKVPNEKSVAYLNIQGKTVPISISESVATNPSLENVILNLMINY